MAGSTGVFILLLMLGINTVVIGGIYTWVDEKGVTHFSDTQPNQSQTKKNRTPVTAFVKTTIHRVPIFEVKDAPDPGIVGKYYPVKPTKKGLPQYRLKSAKIKDKRELPILFVYPYKGKWRWEIKSKYNRFFSKYTNEGTAPDADLIWTQKKMLSDPILLTIVKEEITTTRKAFEYEYKFNMNQKPDQLLKWQKMAFRVSDHRDNELNGIYRPVTWSSALPRYRNDEDKCLLAGSINKSWVWRLGKCDMLGFTSNREPEGTMAHDVKIWNKNSGYSVVSFTVEKITH